MEEKRVEITAENAEEVVNSFDKITSLGVTLNGSLNFEKNDPLLLAIKDLHEKHGYHRTCEFIARTLLSYSTSVLGADEFKIENEHYCVEGRLK